MKNLFKVITLLSLLSPFNASAMVAGTNGVFTYTTSDTISGAITVLGGCLNIAPVLLINSDTLEQDYLYGCSGGNQLEQLWPVIGSGITNDLGWITSSALTPYLTITTAASTYFPKPAGTTSQYVRGDGTLATLPTSGTRSFTYPSRALNSCFQISSTNDAEFHYKVDVTTGLSLTTGAQGTVSATSYTNSGCTTGAQVLADGTSSQTGTLVVGLALNQIADVPLDGILPSGKWIKISTANTVGTPTFAIRAVQAEIILP